MSDRDFERATVSMDESLARSGKGETMKLDYIQHAKEYQRCRLNVQPGCAKEEILEGNLAVLQRKPGAAYVSGSDKVLDYGSTAKVHCVVYDFFGGWCVP
mgnify:CR=1 FL=1